MRTGLRQHASRSARVAAIASVSALSHAATVTWNAPDTCQAEEKVVWEAEKLLGRMLSSVETSNFEVRITELAGKDLHLQLDKIDVLTGSRRTRELTAKNCSDVTAAAAVAIAASIQADDEGLRATLPPPETPERAPARASAPRRSVNAPTDRKALKAGAPGAARTRFSATLAGVADLGALPGAAPGVEVEAALSVTSFRLIALGALFASQHAELDGGLAATSA